jgi:uncharacterized protein (TIGR02246 family)
MPKSPIEVVSAQVDAYNARDLETFLGFYRPDAMIEDGTGQVLMSGHDAMRAFYGQIFRQSPDLRCEIRNRIAVGPYVADEEAISGLHFEGFPTELHAGALYRVEDGQIVNARLLM